MKGKCLLAVLTIFTLTVGASPVVLGHKEWPDGESIEVKNPDYGVIALTAEDEIKDEVPGIGFAVGFFPPDGKVPIIDVMQKAKEACARGSGISSCEVKGFFSERGLRGSCQTCQETEAALLGISVGGEWGFFRVGAVCD